MPRQRLVLFALYLCLIIVGITNGYYLWSRHSMQSFSCSVNFIQHHTNETLYLWLNYSVAGGSGILSMNGHAQSLPQKNISRKIFFKIQRENDVYHLTSFKIIKFPDDNVEDSWMEKYEPEFFIHSDKSIYISIMEHGTGDYIFILEKLPTYLCRSSKNDG